MNVNMGHDKYDQPFKFPDALCKMIDEASPHGFVIFFIDGTGNPDVRLNFAHGMAEGAIRDYGARFFNSITKSLDIQEVEGFLDQQGGPSDSEGGEEDEN